MYFLTISFYSISLIAQLAATTVSISLVKQAKEFRLGWLFLGVASFLMLGRRISPIFYAINSGQFNFFDAALSIPISVFLLLGVLGLKKVLNEANQLNERLSKITKEDYLTLALSRQETFERTKLEIARSTRTKRPIALLSLDVDHFKHINDEFGHQVGDQVLKGMVGFIKSKIRNIDFIGRIGGEEFLIVLPETNEIAAKEVAERLREGLSHFCCCVHCGEKIQITVSIGIVIIALEKERKDYSNILQAHLDKADSAMYEAKRNGRNRCHLFNHKD